MAVAITDGWSRGFDPKFPRSERFKDKLTLTLGVAVGSSMASLHISGDV